MLTPKEVLEAIFKEDDTSLEKLKTYFQLNHKYIYKFETRDVVMKEFSPIIFALKNGKMKAAEMMISLEKFNINYVHVDERKNLVDTILSLAMLHGDTHLLKIIIDKGASCDQVGADEKPLFHYIVELGLDELRFARDLDLEVNPNLAEFKMIKFFVKNNKTSSINDIFKGKTVYDLLAEDGHWKAFSTLLDAGDANLNQYKKGHLYLIAAVKANQVDVVSKILQKQEFNFNQKNSDGETAYSVAAQAKNYTLIKVMLNNDKFNLENVNKMTLFNDLMNYDPKNNSQLSRSVALYFLRQADDPNTALGKRIRVAEGVKLNGTPIPVVSYLFKRDCSDDSGTWKLVKDKIAEIEKELAMENAYHEPVGEVVQPDQARPEVLTSDFDIRL